MELMLEDILAFCTGKQEDGAPMAGSSISIFGVTKHGQPITKQNVTFNQPLEVHAVGGCVTIAIDFKKCPEFYRSAKICMDWLEKSEDTLIYTMIPMALEGKITVLLRNLVYCDFYEKKNGMLRLILAFDNNETCLFGSDNIDYDNIKTMVDNEFQKKQRELDEELEKYIKEKEDLEKQSYEMDVLGDMDILEDDGFQEDGPLNRPGVRFGDDEEDDDNA